MIDHMAITVSDIAISKRFYAGISPDTINNEICAGFIR